MVCSEARNVTPDISPTRPPGLLRQAVFPVAQAAKDGRFFPDYTRKRKRGL